MVHLNKNEKEKVKDELTRFIRDELANHRPWYSKLFSKRLRKIPYPVASLLVFGWPVIALPLLELFVDWDKLLGFQPPPLLLTYLFTSMILALFPLFFTSLFYWWEKNTYHKIVIDLFFIQDIDRLANLVHKEKMSTLGGEKRKQILLDGALNNYKQMMLQKTRLNVRFVNSKASIIIAAIIAFLYIYATAHNTGYPFLYHYIPYFFILFFTSEIIIGSLSQLFLMKSILISFERTIKIVPAHPDGLGGVAPLKDMSINTTIVISSIAIVIPWLFSIPVILEERLWFLTYVAFGFIPLLIWFIFYVFFSTTYILYRSLNSVKEKTVGVLFQEYSDALAKFQAMTKEKYGLTVKISDQMDGTSDKFQDLSLYVSLLKGEYQDVLKMKTWPVSIPILGKLVGTAIVPILMPIINLILAL